MFFADVPLEDPEMFIEKDTLEVGYSLRGNCTSPPSYPFANITWFLNGRKVSRYSLSWNMSSAVSIIYVLVEKLQL